MTILLIAVGLLWFSFTARAIYNALHVPVLPALPPESSPAAALPRVSVVIAARNEGGRIEESVRRLFGQQGIQLQLIAVNDRSTDATGAILDRLAAEDTRLKVVHVDTLPPGWLGKCHACSRGAEQADGDWLLFTDGDIHMSVDLVARGVATAQREQAQHLTLWPGILCHRWFARAAILAWGQLLIIYAPAAQINRDRGNKALGVGAFNLVWRQAYLAIGGHQPLRMEVIDDVKLGLLLRRAGFRQRIYSATHELEAEWADSVGQAIRNLEKNWFAAVEYNVWKSLAVVGTILAAMTLGLAGPFLNPAWGWFALAGMLSTSILGGMQAYRAHWPLATALLVPLGFSMFAFAGIHSTWKTLRQGGVRWRDTFYPLAELRAGMIR